MNVFSRFVSRGAMAALAAAVVASPAIGQSQAEPFEWSGALAAGQTLEIKGVNGWVRAVPATGPNAVVEAARTGRRNDPSEVEIVVVEHANGVTVCAVYPSSLTRQNECLPGDEGRISSRNNDVKVEFTVEVPASVDFVGRTTNGDVSADGVSGGVWVYSTNGDVEVDGGSEVVARTTNGSVRIRSDGVATARSTNGSIRAELESVTGGEDPLRFSTTNGSVTLVLPSNANAMIDAATSNGSIETDFPITVLGRIRRTSLEGSIGSGGPTIELRTTNGAIHLERGI